ncbi:hypothetical protein ZWY2020_023080 [Hordeum vulgare]|nr:hypothetical protein ZWY2020_023080 [Hordeum vulgare]
MHFEDAVEDDGAARRILRQRRRGNPLPPPRPRHPPCRAVCRRWRRLAEDPSFIAARARARHLPLEVLAYTTTTVQESGSSLDALYGS